MKNLLFCGVANIAKYARLQSVNLFTSLAKKLALALVYGFGAAKTCAQVVYKRLSDGDGAFKVVGHEMSEVDNQLLENGKGRNKLAGGVVGHDVSPSEVDAAYQDYCKTGGRARLSLTPSRPLVGLREGERLWGKGGYFDRHGLLKTDDLKPATMKTLREKLILISDLYGASRGVGRQRVSTLVLNRGSTLDAVAEGRADVTTGTFERAMVWFSDHWPDALPWPDEVSRPIRSAVAVEAAE